MQMGCDPKHDSTKQLLNNARQVTVLDYISDVTPDKRNLDDIVIKGSNGILCIEAGGPQPGIGCAGRGILTSFDVLNKLGMRDIPLDFTIYDVLGDVVCGGFAVPMRQEYADAIYVVTSGEYMSIYAANNIFRGVLNFGGKPRVGGIIINRRGIKDEEAIVRRFADAVGVPVVAVIPRDPLFQEAESRGRTLCELYPDSDTAACYGTVAADMTALLEGKKELFLPSPLSDADLEELVFGRAVSVIEPECKKEDTKKRMNGIESCASRGAVYQAGRVIDLPILIHGPRACGYVMSHTQDNHYLQELAGDVRREAILRNNIRCTDMADRDCIFGGKDVLRRSLLEMISEGKRFIMVITTCVSGMIGDDIRNVIEDVRKDHPDAEIIPVFADGNLSGSSDAGRQQVASELIRLIDERIQPTEDALNLIDDTFMQFNSGSNQFWLEELLSRIGMRLGVKLFEECTLDDIRGCRRNRYAAMVSDSPGLRAMFSSKLEILDGTLPSGISETTDWVTRICARRGYDCTKAVELMRKEYGDAVKACSEFVSGKKVVVAVSSFFDVDWMLECLMDAGADILGMYTFRMGRTAIVRPTRYEGVIPVVRDLPIESIISEVESLHPDFVVGSQHIADSLGCHFVPLSTQSLTHFASIDYLELVSNIIRSPRVPGWKSWGDGL